MPQMNQISLVDGSDTAHVFKPNKINAAGVAFFVNMEGLSTVAAEQLTVSAKLPSPKGAVSRSQARIVIPLMDTSVTPAKKIGEDYITVELVASKDSTGDRRTVLVDLLAAALVNADVRKHFVELESSY